MLTKNTTHQYTQAEINRYTPEIDPELPTEFQIGTESRQVTTSDDDREMDFSNFMQQMKWISVILCKKVSKMPNQNANRIKNQTST